MQLTADLDPQINPNSGGDLRDDDPIALYLLHKAPNSGSIKFDLINGLGFSTGLLQLQLLLLLLDEPLVLLNKKPLLFLFITSRHPLEKLLMLFELPL